MVNIDWLLQAGFRIRGDRIAVAIDPYLSNACQEIYGLRRRRDAPVAAADLAVDAICISHWHEDHLDLPSVQEALTSGTVVVGPPSCLDRIRGRRSDHDPTLLRSIAAGQTIDVGPARITAVPASHRVPGYLTEDAVGYVIEIDGVRVHHTGDTEYDRSLLAAGTSALDVSLVCINGTGGNMNPIEAAALTAQLRPRIVVPMHFGLWTDDGYGPEAHLDPSSFVEYCAALAPDTLVAIASADKPLEISVQMEESGADHRL
jgi:L-ascorbate metabolism protein UlaG (beta-lactamase superfamily)